MNESKINRHIFFFLLIYIGALFHRLSQFIRFDFQRSEMYSNWLINYRGGFIRRGLGGSIILQISSVFNVSTTSVTNVFCVSVWLFVIGFFLLKFIRKQYPFFILLMPFFIGETILVDPSCFLRKDCFCLMIFILICSLFFKYFGTINKRNKTLFFLGINFLFILGILVHEVVFFFAFPILFFSCCKKCGSWFKSFLFFVPAITAFLCCELIFSYETAKEMLRLTPQIKFDYVGFLFTPFFQSFLVLWRSANDPNLLFTLFYALIWVFSVYFGCINFHKIKIDLTKDLAIDSGFLSRILIFQFLSIFPLFCCTWDWGRWIFLWVASSFAYFLIADDNPFERKIFEKTDLYSWEIIQKIGKNPTVVFSVAILINCQYMLPLEKDFFIHTPAFEVLNLISQVIFSVKDLF